MRIKTRTETVPIYDVRYDEMGEIILQMQTGIQEVTITDIYADEGNVLIDRTSGKVLSEHVTLGTNDAVENYIETEA